jgi:hypothetical protein
MGWQPSPVFSATQGFTVVRPTTALQDDPRPDVPGPVYWLGFLLAPTDRAVFGDLWAPPVPSGGP